MKPIKIKYRIYVPPGYIPGTNRTRSDHMTDFIHDGEFISMVNEKYAAINLPDGSLKKVATEDFKFI